jgi:[glutamine synthetase] adenylyltransferase / [glutamine synthetase]-adenylyl-L-tyrosine phosphorylase
MDGIIAGFDPKCDSACPSYSKPMSYSEQSRFAKRVRERYAHELAYLPPGLPQEAHLRCALERLQRTHPLESALRILRQLVMQRLLSLDCDHGLGLKEVMLCICTLAQFALSRASEEARQVLAKQWGLPQTQSGEEAQIWVVAMGKLGAKELNVSSDIDVVYVYEEEGYTSGPQYAPSAQSISNQEYFLKWVRLMAQLISAVSEHGFVFRLDLDLRPFGSASATALSLQALEVYFKQNARPWERFAWLKARVLQLSDASPRSWSKRLSAVILPFVFRPYVDFSLVQAMRSIHQQIQEQAQKDALKHPGLLDIKLGRGGIREIEFGVQLLQLARVGTHPELRTRSTLKAIEFLRLANLLDESEARSLKEAYIFLRRMEHRIQYLDDQQTHRLPKDPQDQDWLARCLGVGDGEALLAELARHQRWVKGYFDRLLAHPAVKDLAQSVSLPASSPSGYAPPASSFAQGGEPPVINESIKTPEPQPPVVRPELEALLDGLGKGMNGAQAARALSPAWSKWLSALKRVPSPPLHEERLGRIHVVLGQAQAWLSQGRVSHAQVQAWLDWMEPLLQRDHYWVLLFENPNVHLQLLLLMGASTWSQAYLRAHPGVIDHWLQPGGLQQRLDSQAMVRTVNARRDALARIEQDDDEQLLAVIRREHQAQMFRILTQDLMGYLSVQEVGDELSALADSVLTLCAQWVWRRLHPLWVGEVPLAIIGYGKLGSKELGYGSDLDLVLLYDEQSLISQDQVSKMARQMIYWLSLKTAQGRLYEIDSALRPNGNSGLLVSSFESFETYQRQLGANTAWTWEHQALTRARFCFGPQALATRFEALRLEVLCAPRDPVSLGREVVAMREKMWATQSIPNALFDPKSSPGGMVDVEFVVQYWVLAHAHRYPELAHNVGNMALLMRAQGLGLIPAPLGEKAAEAYRELRQRQHQSSLHERPLRCDPRECLESITAVKALWASQWGA